mmetsp:Transcript_26878/g.58657  ORF Transcript_26878/g.58657 Transcript_26878/m.58657 type:complete len:232 (+) Transcript_26878:140-835(+)|eukprot:CAMPEP_0202892158 /NCGR_PEP_ID=MMETSP1392-20130828/1960_1 /ASSEMBLY_ACC=CAM_ASM_000868 /TAXON_ID=225041 /ORGANISM="Chlamydomonas chlamydogama, Strain SAG 11-48b" /LENGTH=231 /DNA_ID=CAMNT_0049576041 /DNA_START=140 /DNA_END=835 /DNA_ORIENTATION=+
MDVQIVGPGDQVLKIPDSGQLRLGPGLTTQSGYVTCQKSGILRQGKGGQTWIEGKQKRYIPAEGDLVVGSILDRMGENFVVDIGAPFNALLPQLSFEGATRRNRPNLHSGDIVHARVVSASRDMEPVLSCMDASGRAAGFGHLKEGISLTVGTATARKLLGAPMPLVLEELSKTAVPFELAVGMNGRVWVCALNIGHNIAIANAISKSETFTDPQLRAYVAKSLPRAAAPQ